MKLILLGAPGAGKGTLAKQIENKFGFAHFSTGEILRENIENKTQLGLLAKPLLDNGQFVPDEIIIEVVKNKISKINNNFILDGFPRTLHQAQTLSKFLQVDKVVYLHADYTVLLDRLSKRRMCSNKQCGAIYNLNTYSQNVCSVCGSALYQRDDDTPEIIKKRFKVFENLTQPLIEYYQNQGKLIKLEAGGSAESTLKQFEKQVIKEREK